jgi:hypothetical protein
MTSFAIAGIISLRILPFLILLFAAVSSHEASSIGDVSPPHPTP